jgi:hypothetical protein
MSASSEETKFPEYDMDLDGAPYACTLTKRERNVSSNATLIVDPSDPMQIALDKYCAAKTPQHSFKQRIALMINSGIRMRSINLNRSLIKHNVVYGINNIVAVPV